MAELWNNIMNFMKDTAFTVGNFPILWWYVIVAAVAVVVILLIVTISVAVSKSKKKKKAKKEQEQTKDSGRIVQERQDDATVYNEVSPDWQDGLKPKHRKKQKKHGKNDTEAVFEEEKADTAVIAETEAVADVAPAAEEEAPIQETPVQEPIEEVVEEPVKDVVEEPVAKAAPAPQPVAPVKQVVYVQAAPKKEEVQDSNKPTPELAEKVQPAPTMMETYQPQKYYYAAPAKQQPVAETTAEEVVEEPAKQDVEEIKENPVVEDTFVEEVAPCDTTQEEPVVEEEITPVVEEKVVYVAPQESKQEVAATTAPRTLPKKKSKTTKKTAEEIANDIEKKTGTNPRKKSSSADKPDVVGTDKLPKKSAKAKKEEEATKAPNATQGEESDELPLITTDPNVETFGKFVIIKNDDNSARPYHFRLLANNGQILFGSESYKSKPKSNSILAFKKVATNIDNFEIDADKAGNWRYKLYNAQHAVIGVGESYSSKQGCENSVQSVIKFAESARLLEDQSE